MNRAAFLDRDGVLNLDHGYVYSSANFEWVTGAREAIALLNQRGYLTIVVTNQSGIARGMYGEQDFFTLNAWMQEQLQPWSARIDAFYFCPHHPNGKVAAYRRVCDCRKPEPGMLRAAIAEHGIDPAQSFLIGDKESDLIAASRVGVKGYHFGGGDLRKLVERLLADR